jgi:exopolysaccharide production protein ExoQ
VLAMLVVLLVVSNSMTSLGCFVVASALMVVASFPTISQRTGFIHLLVGGTITVIFLVLFVGIGGLLLQSLGRNATLTGRTELWPALLELAGNPVIGTGFESFWLGERLEKMWSLYWWHPTQAHNGYLEIYLTLGWIGIGLLALVAIWGYRNIIGMFRYDPVGAKLRLAYFVVAIAYDFTESAFKTLHPVWLGFLLAIIVPPKAVVKRAAERSTRASAMHRGSRRTRALVGANSALPRQNVPVSNH